MADSYPYLLEIFLEICFICLCKYCIYGRLAEKGNIRIFIPYCYLIWYQRNFKLTRVRSCHFFSHPNLIQTSHDQQWPLINKTISHHRFLTQTQILSQQTATTTSFNSTQLHNYRSNFWAARISPLGKPISLC